MLFSFISSFSWAAQDLPSGSLLLVHTSKHYHTDPQTIEATNRLVQDFSLRQRQVIALAQNDIADDPLWYSYRERPYISQMILSRMGEHLLQPVSPSGKHQVTVVGGYHSACLGLALAELIARFAAQAPLTELEIVLPMQAIFTGFYWQDGKLAPSIEYESYADSSLDGLNLYQATHQMSDQEWAAFINESLKWAIFKRGPMVRADFSQVTFQVERDDRTLLTLSGKGSRKTVRLKYLN